MSIFKGIGEKQTIPVGNKNIFDFLLLFQNVVQACLGLVKIFKQYRVCDPVG